MHTRGRVHGDIKIDNFAFNSNPQESLIKIFGNIESEWSQLFLWHNITHIIDFGNCIEFEASVIAPVRWLRTELSFRQDILRLARILIQLAGKDLELPSLYGQSDKSNNFIRNVQNNFLWVCFNTFTYVLFFIQNIVPDVPCKNKLIQFFEMAWNLNTNQMNYGLFRAILK